MGASCVFCGCHDNEASSKRYTTVITQPENSTAPNPNVHLDLQMDGKTLELLMKMENNLMSPMEDISPTAEFLKVKTQPPVKRITTPDKSLSADNERLDNIASVETMNELQHLMGENYDTDCKSESDESDHSELCETDKLEIEQRKLNTYKLEEEYEMQQQLLNLSKQVSNEKMHQLHESNQLSQEIMLGSMVGSESDVNDEDLPDSNLFRDPSQAKWDEQSIQKTKKEMRRQMLILASQNKTLR